MFPVFLFVLVLIIITLTNIFKILKEYERGVIFRLGRYVDVRGPGLTLLLPYIEKMVKVNLRTVVMDVPPQDVITKDNISIKVNAVVYFRVINPSKAVLEVEDYYYATSQISQTTLRSVAGQFELDEILSHRDKINQELQNVIDKQTDPWGIKVSSVEIKHIDLPIEMQRAMARQAEAERERRAKIIHADGELQSSEKLSQASKIMAENPLTIQLRYLQTLTEIASEKNSTIVFPLPIELLRAFGLKVEKEQ
ncbi:slipin family protein [Calditerrivibrio nitroreducens]|uniref:SPFH domain, Band 7 family protein n=1 Tax=Calditerrivibrio nitroreducens (strain DSM 19672 / NBRC 101217 / Yu37-1) TaxID=768670 RepID=E4THZ9_CALNY|nr:slipin family protein [Calditerrivibrio nitroreducens]ADR18929.1 SPFH domain, Band 7 family protein [Calditerrivibrio nitroreducens DSM 19672]